MQNSILSNLKSCSKSILRVSTLATGGFFKVCLTLVCFLFIYLTLGFAGIVPVPLNYFLQSAPMFIAFLNFGCFTIIVYGVHRALLALAAKGV